MSVDNFRLAPSNIFHPWNRDIPYFHSEAEYNNRLQVPFPAGRNSTRRFPWLVEPGMQSIEAYQRILALTNPQSRQPRRLRTYICTAGVVRPRGDFVVPRWGISPSADPRERRERDVCFTLLSFPEHRAIQAWFWAEAGIEIRPCLYVATPMGGMMMASPGRTSRRAVCERLGLGGADAQFPMSQLPKGVLRIGTAGVHAWSVAESRNASTCGLAYSDFGFRRVYWL